MLQIIYPGRPRLPRLFIALLAGGLLSIAGPVIAEGNLADVIGDGEPWEMYVVKRKASNILVFRPDGHGTISDGLAGITVTWRAVAGGICIKPQGQPLERCHALEQTLEGIAASQNGRVVFILKR